MEKTCDLCKFPMMIFDLNDPDKPLRCSDACPDNRKSIADRGVSLTEEDKDKEEKDTRRTTRKHNG